MNKKILFLIVVINTYFVGNLFVGNNNIMNFFSFKKEIASLEEENKNLIMQRYKIEQLYNFLSDKNSDNYDILDELLRQTTQSSLPEEKIIMLDTDK